MPSRTAARRPAPSRLPAVAPRSRGVEVVLGLFTLVATLAVVVAVPWALLRAFGPPWPDTMPTENVLTAQVDAGLVLQVIAVVVWLAWLHFCVCLLVEAAAEIRGRGLAPRVPGGGVGTQALARRVVALILLVTGAGVATVPMAAATVSEPPQAAVQRMEPAASAPGNGSGSPAAEVADAQAAGRLPSQATAGSEPSRRGCATTR